MSVIQAEGLGAVFECLYPGVTYSWLLNGTILSNFPTSITTNSPLEGSPATLTIPARPEYNNTVVQCEAIVRVGRRSRELSKNAMFLVYGESMYILSIPICVVLYLFDVPG